MQCPTCGTINPAPARFCMGCGVVLVNGLVCNNCHTLLPPQACYCYHCGTYQAQSATPATRTGVSVTAGQAASPPGMPPAPIDQPVPIAAPEAPSADRPPSLTTLQALDQLPPPRPLEAMLPSLAHYLPQDLYEPLERRPKGRDILAVRDQLTALISTVKTYLPWPVVRVPQPAGVPTGGMYGGVFLFGDVSGFTPLSERLKALGQQGAEIITVIINTLFTDLVSVLFDHGGTLLKFGGDALLGLFPVETDEEMNEAALRATQAALAMQQVLKKDQFSAIEAQGEVRALAIKCGISAGPYFAAHIGTGPSELDFNGTMAYVTTGHTVNLAEEAEGHANPGEVAMTRHLFELLGERVESEPVTKSPDEDFRLLLSAPSLEAGELSRLGISEPPEGDPMAQITYLVERLDRLTPYLSDELVSRIVTNPVDARITPEHRPVTVMFANYKGISRLIEKMGHSDPNLITRHLNDYFVHMASIVERYEGTVARMDQYSVGDRLVIFFGAPRAHEDDPVRAIFTALEMQEAVRKNFAALRTATGVYRFEQRIGVNTGHLFAGNAGAPDLRQEYTLMGDDINMAARLMSNAGWNDIFISRKTKDHVAAFFELQDKGELKVKGKEVLIPTFSVLGRRDQVGRTRGLGEVESPLTGRDELLATLQDRAGDFLTSRRGQIISLIGNSGLGKSRSLREMKAWLLAQEGAKEVRWIEARALSFSEQMSYWMAGQMMRDLLDVGPDATQDDVLYALGERCEELLGEEAMDAVPYLAHMMALDLGQEWAWVKELDPKVRQKQTFWAASEFLTAAARKNRIVIALDDLHWADEATLALTEQLLEVTNQAPLLFCLVFRARRDKHCWKLRETAAREHPHRYNELPLQPLDRETSAQLLNKLLPGARFRSETQDEILDKSAGNPFYLEEVVRSLIESGAVVPATDQEGSWRVIPDKIAEITVPDTLHAAIVARIDRLTEDARQALQTAAVIGRQFRLELLRNLSQAEAEIDLWMAQLERGGMVRPAEISQDPIYAFPDALVQEVAYDSLLVQSRQGLHRRIGETLEGFFADDPEQGCELLAFHFSRSDDPSRAIEYLEMAAKKARNEYANETAIQYYERLLDIRRELGDIVGQSSSLYSMGVIAYEIGDYERARSWLGESAALQKDQGDTANESWSVMYLGMVDLKQADYAQAVGYHQRAMKLAQRREDTFQEGIHLTNLARVTMRLGQYELALEQFEKSLEMKRQMNDVVGVGFTLFYQGLIYIYLDRHAEAQTALQGAIEAWEEIPKNERVVSYYHYGAGLLAFVQGQLQEAEEHLSKAIDLSTRLVLKAETIENLSALSQVKLALGEHEAAAEYSNKAILLLSEQKDVEEVQQIYLNHYRVLSALNDLSAGEYLQEAQDTMVKRANRIEDDEQRRIYLEGVKVNQEIQAQILIAG